MLSFNDDRKKKKHKDKKRKREDTEEKPDVVGMRWWTELTINLFSLLRICTTLVSICCMAWWMVGCQVIQLPYSVIFVYSTEEDANLYVRSVCPKPVSSVLSTVQAGGGASAALGRSQELLPSRCRTTPTFMPWTQGCSPLAPHIKVRRILYATSSFSMLSH